MITPMRVFVLIFNANTENEGIHTVRVGDRNKILMFESQDDAVRFALMLEAQDFPTPTVEGIDAEDVKEFCASANYDWELIPENSDLVIPPDINVEETDWQPDGQYDDEDTEDEIFESDLVPPAQDSEFSETELENIRRKLEGLL
ncbi:conserved hypothetical protein [Trichormus variabilis ATCC 29413]|uniref:DUF3110 domain-containing protein n=2 Tax=Anabaena variabilis TaxID=264691 RepID=Q3MGL9_TRIV2|nr:MULTISPECIES: DUF3110 domain-containing protein [Nostocaceae]ABA19867.1 conserved hypothetical protein [Trichormus variabilis ATCC 29413]MBC1216088.1 DUF3110 domain-containing protein [Trichormus variabilis ARAD]MBC1253848.1 DUF3110 domain-containing protein [Trichormus variabilis V5]MBC1266688.1 DUF3110 domain-containing protein [Trichormus variabilis FSR]MBC1303326.1 DUF3110 domain-containing protein [Trichormus variabilis N2B]